jgi:cytidylyltransferase-like protein
VRALLDAAAAPLVTGHFDPLTPAHARRLSELAETHGPLFVLVTDPPDPILPAGARAELVASLACVRCIVLPPPQGPEAILESLPAHRLLREEAADLQRREALTRHVHARHADAFQTP